MGLGKDSSRQLVAVAAPIEAVPGEGRQIKGFVSVEREDRSGDYVPAKEFNVDQFMAIPTMMLNHKFLLDENMNEVGVGRPEELFVAKLKTNKENDEVYDIVDSKGEVRNTFPKTKVPNLKSGDRGLFVVATITRDEVWSMVEDGEINAFSWRGMVKVKYQVNPKTRKAERVLTDIDLFEISVVNVPDNPNASFMIGKSFLHSADDDCDYVVHQVRILKSKFPTTELATDYCKSHGLDSSRMREDEQSYYYLQRKASDLDIKKLVNVKLADGVIAITGPMLEEAKSHLYTDVNCFVATELGEEAKKHLLTIWENSEMATQTEKGNGFTSAAANSSKLSESDPQVTTAGIAGTDGNDGGVPGGTASGSGGVSNSDPQVTSAGIAGGSKKSSDEVTTEDTRTDAEKALEGVIKRSAQATGQAIVEGLKPVFGELVEGIKGALATPTEDTQEVETVEETTDGEENSAEAAQRLIEEATKSFQQTMAQQLEDFQKSVSDQLQTVSGKVNEQAETAQKAAKQVANSMPSRSEREEHSSDIEVTSKTAGESSPNDVFNQCWPMFR